MSENLTIRQTIWRQQLKKIFLSLKNQWIPAGLKGSGLITDLYDEATYVDYLLEPLIASTMSWTGIDKSRDIAMKAVDRIRLSNTNDHKIAICDVRQLTFKPNSFDYVLSHSTLDHFEDDRDICQAICEIHHVLKPGGVLIITLDNPQNPVVWLRNHVPMPVLRFLNIVPYQIGKTISARCLRLLLEQEGFSVKHNAFIDHGPRFITIRFGQWLNNNDRACDIWSRCLNKLEKMRYWPSAQFTGYFHVALVTKEDIPTDYRC